MTLNGRDNTTPSSHSASRYTQPAVHGTETLSLITTEMEYRQWDCKHAGCGKSFARKEHLARHEKSHNPANLLQCPVCKRHFNRNDSLQRHVVKHGAEYKQNPSGRSKRACIVCRAGKTKCDGGEPCAKCAKRGIDCQYGQEDGSQRDESPSWGGTTEVLAPPTSSREVDAPQPSEEPRSARAAAKTPGLVDWTLIQIRPDPQPQPIPAAEVGIRRDESEKYLEVYFDQFHHRWPILHRPSHDEEVNETDLCKLSMRMMGAWLLGNDESVQFAEQTHIVLVDHIMSQLCQVTSHDRFQQSLPIWICNAALLNIIFVLYYGHDREMSRAIILWNILMAALRETGFFHPGTAWPDEKQGYFLPMRLVKLEQRHRLAYNMFKLDSYMSLLRNKPMTIFPEELHFSLPCTFSLWNADGLHIWEERQIQEPTYRDTKSMASLIAGSALDTTQEEPMLIEDIHLCLCAMQSDIWRHYHNPAPRASCEFDNVLRRDTLRRQLDGLNSRLDQILAQNLSLSDLGFGQEVYLPYRYYYGYEDHTQPGRQETVTTRVKSILFDTVMLYFLLSLHLAVDIRKIAQITKDRRPDTIEELSEVHRVARVQRHTSMKDWAATPAARFALCQSVDVLVAYQNFKRGSGTSANVRTLDPICHAALSVGALVVWTFCKYYDYGCDVCTLEPMPVAEMTAWTMSGSQFSKEKESWIEMGERGTSFRPQLQGIQICQCNTEFLMNLFQVCLPNGWALADSIAPGIFKPAT
ncbi:uncharacterized protein PAC_06414 [Phialocephala subalpina]|uniref:Uncharacterized protein n=1 Tax=Phialocephala subalpina TaxID=576137 RepID=A0A1L7WUR6_9HELO|nr:uncharacterized protein PAC_06414 [Phialocephala subalpina]